MGPESAGRSTPPSRPRPRQLLETQLEGGPLDLLSITGGKDISLWEVPRPPRPWPEAATPTPNIFIFGAMGDGKSSTTRCG